MRLPQIPLLALLALSACGGPSYGAYRDAVKEELRDPDSAIFKDEQVRTLWSNDGSRLTVYCAKVNANNIMGGKTGFKPLTLILDAVHKRSEEHTSELQSLMRISYAVFRLKTQHKDRNILQQTHSHVQFRAT